MRIALLPLLLPLLATTPLAAQFEGTIAMTASANELGTEAIAMQYHVQKGRVAIVMVAPASAGPMAGSEMRMLMDPDQQKMTLLMPVSGQMAAMMGGAKGIKMIVDLKDLPTGDETAPTGSVKKLGTTQQIAGHRCEDHEVTTGNETFTMCLADGLGSFLLATGGMGSSAQVPTWARNLEGKFPLKVVDAKGRATLTVTAITPGTVPAALFEVPATYQDMGGMMGGMGGGSRRNN